MNNKNTESVQVVVRCRPFTEQEERDGRKSIVTIDPTLFQVIVDRSDDVSKTFTFDAVYGAESTQRSFYDESCYDLVESVLEGFNATIFAYGQTGCGKTHTMQGYQDPPELRGVIPNSIDHIFESVTAASETTFLVRCSYLEIYNEDIRDLLVARDCKAKLELREDPMSGVYVQDLSSEMVGNESSITNLMKIGQARRTTGSTQMNEASSRSHAIFTIVVEMNDIDSDGKDHIRVGKLNLVDLAGSERQSKSGATGSRLKEGCKINLSLSALGNVISALVEGNGKHVPYRDSKLTRLLQDSLGGNTKTLMVAAISPADCNYEETMSTLRYANRAKNIKNKPRINEDPKDAMLRQYKEEIARLKELLEQRDVASEAFQATHGKEHTLTPTLGENNPSAEQAAITLSSSSSFAPQVLKATEQQWNDFDRQLRAKEEQVEAERMLRINLENKLHALQRGIIGMAHEDAICESGEQNNAGGGANVVLAKQHRDSRRMAAKLRHQKKKDAQIRAEKMRVEIERAQEEDEMRAAIGAAEDEVSRLKKSKSRLERKIAEMREEMTDMHIEHEREREDFMENTREMAKELLLWEQVVRLILPAKEISKIWERAEYYEDEERWEIPGGMQLKFSTSSAAQGGDNNGSKLPMIAGEGVESPWKERDARRRPSTRRDRMRDKESSPSQNDDEHKCKPDLSAVVAPPTRLPSRGRPPGRIHPESLPFVRPGTRGAQSERSGDTDGIENWGFGGFVGRSSPYSSRTSSDRVKSRQGKRRGTSHRRSANAPTIQ